MNTFWFFYKFYTPDSVLKVNLIQTQITPHLRVRKTKFLVTKEGYNLRKRIKVRSRTFTRKVTEHYILSIKILKTWWSNQKRKKKETIKNETNFILFGFLFFFVDFRWFVRHNCWVENVISSSEDNHLPNFTG